MLGQTHVAVIRANTVYFVDIYHQSLVLFVIVVSCWCCAFALLTNQHRLALYDLHHSLM